MTPELKAWLDERASAIEQLEGVLAEELMKRDARIAKLEAEIADEMLTWGLACECTCDHCVTLQRHLNSLLAPLPTPDSPSG